MDSLLTQFHHQYLQQVTNLRYPSSKLLVHPDIQHQLHRYFFDDTLNAYLPPPTYQRRVLKRLVADIVKEAHDEDDEVSDDLMAHMGFLSSLPRQSDAEVAQMPRVLSYFLPDGPGAEVTTSTFDAGLDARNGVGLSTQGQGEVSVERVIIRESPQLLAAGSNVGLRTWEACLRLAHYLCTSRARSTMRGANVLELGAGTGLLSLICSMSLGAGNVLVTDGLEQVVESIEGNIALNKEQIEAEGKQIRFPSPKLLDWTDLSNLDDVLAIDGEVLDFDYIFGADITYHPELLDPLASLISMLRDRYPKCRVLISATVRNEDTLKLWRKTCAGYGLVMREVNEEEDRWSCPQYWLQTGLFHEQVFPIVIMDITK